MPSVNIWCTTAEVAVGKFIATVCAVPAGAAAAGAFRSQAKVLATSQSAEAECDRMAQAMKQDLASVGYDVISVEIL